MTGKSITKAGQARRAALPLSLLLAGALSAGSAPAQELTYGSGVPERSAANREGVLPLLEAITAATEGRVSFTPILGGQLVSIPGALEAIADGVVDSGFLITQFYPSDLPAAALMSELTGLGTDPFATMGALNEAYFVDCAACRADFEALGVVPALLQSAAPLTMQCTQPVATAADLAGLRVATIGRPEMRWATALGMVPVQTAISDLLSALQLGMTDCAIIGTSWIRSYGLEDTIKGVIEMPQGIIAGAVPLAFNADSWAAVEDADRAAIRGLMAATLWDYVSNAYVTPDVETRAALTDRIAFAPGDAALTEAWQAFSAGEAAALRSLAAERGIADSDALIDRIIETFRVWHEDLLPQFAGDREAFIRIANDRIFNRIDL